MFMFFRGHQLTFVTSLFFDMFLQPLVYTLQLPQEYFPRENVPKADKHSIQNNDDHNDDH